MLTLLILTLKGVRAVGVSKANKRCSIFEHLLWLIYCRSQHNSSCVDYDNRLADSSGNQQGIKCVQSGLRPLSYTLNPQQSQSTNVEVPQRQGLTLQTLSQENTSPDQDRGVKEVE